MSNNEHGTAGAAAPAADTVAHLAVKTTVAELLTGDLYLPIKRETLSMNIPAIEFIRPVDMEGKIILGMMGEDVHCVILHGETTAKLIRSDKVVFRASRAGE